MDALWQDLRQAVRSLKGTPGFVVVVVLTLGLGIGANAAVFSVVNALILRPMPVKDPARIVVIASVQRPSGEVSSLVSYPDYLDYRAASDAFDDIAATRLTLVGLGAGTYADRILINYVTSNYFSMFGIEPAVGRLIGSGASAAARTSSGRASASTAGHSRSSASCRKRSSARRPSSRWTATSRWAWPASRRAPARRSPSATITSSGCTAA